MRAGQAELFLIQLCYRKAAERFAAAAKLVPDSKSEQRLDYREQYADALYRQGEEKGDNSALKEQSWPTICSGNTPTTPYPWIGPVSKTTWASPLRSSVNANQARRGWKKRWLPTGLF